MSSLSRQQQPQYDHLEQDAAAVPNSASSHAPADDVFVFSPGGLRVNGLSTDGLLSQENSELRDRVGDLEQRVQSQADELVCLRSALSDCLRRLASVETSKGGFPPAAPNYNRLSVAPTNASLTLSPSGAVATNSMAVHSAASPKSVGGAGAGAKHSASGSAKPGRKPQSAPMVRKPTRSDQPSQSSALSSPSGGGHKSSSGAHSTGVGPASPRPGAGGRGSSVRGSTEQSQQQTASHGSSVKESVWSKEDGVIRMHLRGRPLNLYAPSDLVEQLRDVQQVEPAEPPAEKLKLEWAYGYRGRDCRSNLYSLPTGEMVYFIASVVVLHNVEEGMQRHYTGHNDDVKCIAVHPDKITIATGQVAGHDKAQGKPHVRVWNSVDLTTMHVLGLGDFERAVCCLAFSRADGGNFLCAVDESNEHMISVWDWRKPHKLAETKTSGDPVLACEYHPLDNGSIVTCGKNQLTFWTIEGGQLSKKNGIFEKHEKPKFVLCLTFAQNGDLITGDSNGNILVWARGGNRISQGVTGAHEGGIFSLCVLKDDNLVSGGKDRRLVQWDATYNRTGSEAAIPEQYGPIRTLSQGPGSVVLVGTTRNCILQGSFNLDFSPIVEGHVEELWGLACHPSQLQFATCAYDKWIYLWDALTHQVVWSKELNDPAHCACFHPSGETLAVGCQTGRWYVLDAQRRDIVAVHTDGNEQIECMEFSPDGSMLALGSRDNYLYVYTCSEAGRKYSRVGKCCGHSSFVTHLDWSVDGTSLRSNSGDHELLFWTAANCRQVPAAATLRDVAWATQRCTLTFHTAGIWPEGADGTDVNACDRNSGHSLLASGDDFGQVCLFRHPCYQAKSRSHAYGGHSSHVANVRFLRDDSRLLSAGGRDSAVLQWEILSF
uniref:HELP domain-containing protein n=2 Tax=Macrostomum lignano TaxID=282301 RepID=A0A1I8HE55_9PLAT